MCCAPSCSLFAGQTKQGGKPALHPLPPRPGSPAGRACSGATRRGWTQMFPTLLNSTDNKTRTQLRFSTHRKKQMRYLKRQKKSGLASAGGASEDPFELFFNSTNSRGLRSPAWWPPSRSACASWSQAG